MAPNSVCEGPANTPSRAFFKISGDMGVHLRVWLSDLSLRHTGEIDVPASSPETSAHHFVITSAIVYQDGSTIWLDHIQLQVLIAAMAEDIGMLRSGWLSISELRTHLSCYPEKSEERQPVPDGTSPLNQLNVVKKTGVVLQWIDSRHEESLPLVTLLQQSPLPRQLRDLVEQFSSRLLVETLLRSDHSAKLFHKCWQLRQREVDPLIGSIALSIRGCLCNASNQNQVALLLQRLCFSQPWPSVIAIANSLTKLDLAANPPAVPPASAGERRVAHQRRDKRLVEESDILRLDSNEDDEILTELETTPRHVPTLVMTTDPLEDDWMFSQQESTNKVYIATVVFDSKGGGDIGNGIVEPPSDPEILDPLDHPENFDRPDALLSDHRALSASLRRSITNHHQRAGSYEGQSLQ